LLSAPEAAALATHSFEALHRAVTAFWRERLAAGMTIATPETWLNDLFRANLWHVLISTDLDRLRGSTSTGRPRTVEISSMRP
jgi:hypothetical protein